MERRTVPTINADRILLVPPQNRGPTLLKERILFVVVTALAYNAPRLRLKNTGISHCPAIIL